MSQVRCEHIYRWLRHAHAPFDMTTRNLSRHHSRRKSFEFLPNNLIQKTYGYLGNQNRGLPCSALTISLFTAPIPRSIPVQKQMERPYATNATFCQSRSAYRLRSAWFDKGVGG